MPVLAAGHAPMTFAPGIAVTVAQPIRTISPGRRGWPAAVACLVLLAACASPTPSPSASQPVASIAASPSATPSPTPEPSPSGPPHLALPPAKATDTTSISYTVTVDLQAGASGKLVVVIINLTHTKVPELVLRWPTAVRDTVFLAPFEPSQQRIREGGLPLVQDWTKWVDGPGEHGEPAGTTSLGWGPLLPGGTLTISVLATRVAPGPITFDLQILNGEAILLSSGLPAAQVVSVP
jgi:hypothetical protein